jgi:hypothetical protein
MAYAPPSITAAGLVIPSYADILADLITQYQTVYGVTVYLGTDSADYQMLSIFALKINDTMQAVQLAYNARSPLTAVGSDLDSIVKLNGMARKAASFSTAPGLVSGIGGTPVTNGIAVDVSGNTWALPSTVIIPTGGSVVVTLTCETAGSIQAAPGQINTIASGGTLGWTGITNPSAASPGQPIEADSQLRARQSFSVALPSRTTLAGTIAGIATVPNVTRYNVHENFTGSVDAAGTPPHSISAVVEGGIDLAVATAIFNNRGIGADTNGTTAVSVTDPNTHTNTIISFSRPTPVPVFVSLTVHGLTGYTSAVPGLIQAALVTYMSSLQIGETLTYGALYSVALSVMPNLLLPQFTIQVLTAGLASSPTGMVDIPVTYNQVISSTAGNVVITVA